MTKSTPFADRSIARWTLAAALAASTASISLSQGALPAPPTPPQNPTTAEKAVLGKMLFWEEQLSSDGTMACGTCHQARTGGADPRLTNTPAHPGPDGVAGTADDLFGSPGVHRANGFGHFVADATFGFGEQSTPRTTPSMMTGAYFPELFWDGRVGPDFVDPLTGLVVIPQGGALEAQSLQPIMNTVEMADEDRSWASVTGRLASARPMALATNLTADMQAALAIDPTYPELFEAAFGTAEITPVRIAFALAAYQRTLVPDQSKFDRVMRGQAQFTPAENRGRGAFGSPQSRCAQCHAGSLFSDRQFHNLGLRPIAEDSGRQAVTGQPGDRGRFKTPSLRNVALRERFFHTGAPGSAGAPAINDLNDLLAFYDADGGAFANNKDQRLIGLTVPPQVRGDIVAFLNTLTDPRVAAETAPFDRPSLWSERSPANRNPLPLGAGAVAGTGGFTPGIIATSPPREGNQGFRVGGFDALGDVFTVLHVDLVNVPGGATTMDLRNGLPLAAMTQGIGAGQGTMTWLDDEALAPVLVGLSYEAQWWVRDFGAVGNVAKSERVRITIE
ncbi:Cytochrome c551 peroxidase precursor [Planctomycetes bacterium Poly30]|uniref:Cytochrome c551 peroxidase n=1 Tax=Saltatorellus ferox TaxID=2528018 RepID=A0A518F093_9BACT|nr:Cytochrome c551 peroxidase precursor [Planctomycetes bacterium Poly30]